MTEKIRRDKEVANLKKMIGHLIWLVEVEHKIDGSHIIRDAKELLQPEVPHAR